MTDNIGEIGRAVRTLRPVVPFTWSGGEVLGPAGMCDLTIKEAEGTHPPRAHTISRSRRRAVDTVETPELLHLTALTSPNEQGEIHIDTYALTTRGVVTAVGTVMLHASDLFEEGAMEDLVIDVMMEGHRDNARLPSDLDYLRVEQLLQLGVAHYNAQSPGA